MPFELREHQSPPTVSMHATRGARNDQRCQSQSWNGMKRLVCDIQNGSGNLYENGAA